MRGRREWRGSGEQKEREERVNSGELTRRMGKRRRSKVTEGKHRGGKGGGGGHREEQKNEAIEWKMGE